MQQHTTWIVSPTVLVLAVVTVMLSWPALARAVEAPYVITRGGIPNASARMKAGEPTTIAYLGGSITAGANAWPKYVTDAFKARYPDTPIEMVNIAIGATGSTLAVFRMDREVMPKNPDLIFMEFAVNDWHSIKDCIDSYEGVIRKVWKVRPSCDFVFVHTTNQEWLDDLTNGRDVVTVRHHEAVAGFYGIPSINIGRKFAARLAAGELEWSDVMGDNVHPHLEGHKVYAQIVNDGLAGMADVGHAVFEHELGEPLYSGAWASATMIPPGKAETTGEWQTEPVPWLHHIFDGVAIGQTPESKLTFDFTGPVIGMFFANGPGAGDIRWRVDKGQWHDIPSFVPEWWKDMHPFWWLLQSGMEPGDTHTLEIELVADPETGETGFLKLGAFLCAPVSEEN